MANSRIKVIGLKEFEKDFQVTLQQVTNRAYYLSLAKRARDLIYARTKSGYGVSDDSSATAVKVKLVPLSPGYVEFRSRFEGLGAKANLGTTPRKSNLTLTGQMLESMEIVGNQNGFTIKIPNTGRSGGGKNPLTNAQVATYVSENGRPWFALTEQEQLILFRQIEKDVRDAFRTLNQRR